MAAFSHAVDINVFWTTPATEELARLRRSLGRDGRLFLFYETPSAAQAHHVIERVVDTLQSNGFTEPQLVSRSATLFGCLGQAGEPGRRQPECRDPISVFRTTSES